MTEETRLPPQVSSKRSRYGFAFIHCLSLVLVWSIFRLILYRAFRADAGGGTFSFVLFLAGFQRDLLVALVLTLPILAWMLIVPKRWEIHKFHRTLFWIAYFIFWFVIIFLLFVEFFFFDEFRSRFNTVAVDYIWYPHEVFINIWESYHVGIILAVCLVLSFFWLLVLRRLF